MRWFKEHGLISSYEDYLALPMGVIADAHLMMEYEIQIAEKERADMEAARGLQR